MAKNKKKIKKLNNSFLSERNLLLLLLLVFVMSTFVLFSKRTLNTELKDPVIIEQKEEL